MEFNLTNILIQILKSVWVLKDFYLIAGAVLLLVLIFRIVKDLQNRKSKIKWFLGKKNIKDLQYPTPEQFEQYISELFHRMGYKTKTVGGVGDGGIDVEAEKDGITHFIQCKKFITQKVTVGAVRDFYGAIVDRVDGGKGYFITTNVFTLDAEKFAEDKPLELVDRFKLMEYVKIANLQVPDVSKATINSTASSLCPKCGASLVERKGRFGRFIGCSTYPKCDYTNRI